MNGLKTASRLLKGQGRGKTHVTLIQEMNIQREVSLPINVSVLVRGGGREGNKQATKKYSALE